jgi:Calx-beta domain
MKRRVPLGVLSGLLAVLVLALLPAGPAGGAAGPPTVRLVTPAKVSEGAPIFFTVRLSRPANRLVTVEYATKNGTATWPDDYRRRTGRVHFKPGQTRRRVRVTTTEDGAFEALERFSMEIKRPAAASASATIAKPNATAKIGDDDPKPTLSISDAQANEGTGSPGQLLFNVQLSKAAGTRVTAQFATANGTAAAGVDYTSSTGTVGFLAGETSKPIAVPVAGDAVDEPNETLVVTLSAPVGATIGDGQAQGTINDDDPPVTMLSIADVSLTEGTGGTKTMNFTVTRSGPATGTSSAQFATSNGSAQQPGDYTSATGTVTFVPADLSESVSVTIKSDWVDEPDETLNVALSSPTGAVLGDGAAVGTINDDDLPCEAASSPPGLNIGTVRGDAGTDSLQQVDLISPCGDTDWFQARMTETSDSDLYVSATVVLQTTVNDSPSAGDLDLCVHPDNTTTSVEKCSTAGAGVTEQVCVYNDDDIFGTDDSTNFFIEVKGFGQAQNSYTLSVFGNQAVTTPANCAVGV